MLVRMLSSIEKWNGNKPVSRQDGYIPGDSLSDLRTTNNTLSTWECTAADIEDAVVALAVGRQDVQKMVVVFLDPAELDKIEISHSEAVGKAPGCQDDILNKHRDLEDLDYWRIGYLAEHITELVKDSKMYKIYTKEEVKKILGKYKANGRLNLAEMNQRLVEKLKWMNP